MKPYIFCLSAVVVGALFASAVPDSPPSINWSKIIEDYKKECEHQGGKFIAPEPSNGSNGFGCDWPMQTTPPANK